MKKSILSLKELAFLFFENMDKGLRLLALVWLSVIISACSHLSMQKTYWWAGTYNALEEEKKGNVIQAETELFALLDRATKKLDDEKIADSLYNLGAFFYRQNYMFRAIYNLQKALELYEKVSDPTNKQIVKTLTILSAAYVESNNIFDGRQYADRLRDLVRFHEYHQAPIMEKVLTFFEADETAAVVKVLSFYDIDLKRYAKDIAKLKPLADAGMPKAQYQLAKTYYEGPDARQLLPEILLLYHAAEARGIADAQIGLAVMYDKGQGVKINKKKARLYYRLAAENNHPKGQWNYYVFLSRGIGGPRNEKEALTWLRELDAQGFPPAQDQLRRLGQ